MDDDNDRRRTDGQEKSLEEEKRDDHTTTPRCDDLLAALSELGREEIPRSVFISTQCIVYKAEQRAASSDRLMASAIVDSWLA
jgi:hypothetical protein